MEVRQLEHFIVVAEELNFTRAARRLYLGQSAVSASVKSLETTVGASLFLRTARSVSLTPEGEALLPVARAVRSAMMEAKDTAAGFRSRVRDRVVLGLVPTPHPVDLTPALSSFLHTHDKLKLDIRADESAVLTSAVSTGELDLAVILRTSSDNNALRFTDLADGRYVAATGAGTSRGERRLSLAEFADLPHVEHGPAHLMRSVTESVFSSSQLSRNTRVEVADTVDALPLVRAGIGVAFLPDYLVEGDPALEEIDLAMPPLTWRLSLAARHGEFRNAVSAELHGLIAAGHHPPRLVGRDGDAAAMNLRASSLTISRH